MDFYHFSCTSECNANSFNLDYNIAYLSRQIQELKLEISGYKTRIRADEMNALSINSATSVNSSSSTLGVGSANSLRRMNHDEHSLVTSAQASASLGRIPSNVRTKKSPKTPASNSGSGGLFSPESSKSSSVPAKTPTLTEKQEQILKNAMELYGHKSAAKPTKNPSSSSGWGFL